MGKKYVISTERFVGTYPAKKRIIFTWNQNAFEPIQGGSSIRVVFCCSCWLLISCREDAVVVVVIVAARIAIIIVRRDSRNKNDLRESMI